MKRHNIAYITTLCLLIAVGAVAWRSFLREYKQEDTVDIHAFPMELNGWKGTELPITDEEYAILETRNAFARRFTGPKGQDVFLLLVYSQHNRKVSHPPEVCYTGSGVSILNKKTVTLPVPGRPEGIKSNKLLLEQGKIEQLLYYWFKVGDTYTPNYWQQQVLIAMKTLLNRPASSALVRLSAVIRDDRPDQAEQDVVDFLAEVMPLLPKYLP